MFKLESIGFLIHCKAGSSHDGDNDNQSVIRQPKTTPTSAEWPVDVLIKIANKNNPKIPPLSRESKLFHVSKRLDFCIILKDIMIGMSPITIELLYRVLRDFFKDGFLLKNFV